MPVLEAPPIARQQQRQPVRPVSPPESGLREYLDRFFSLSAREEAIRAGRLYSMEVELTRRCNLECPYCYSDSHACSTVDLPRDVVRRLLKDGFAYGLRSVSWFGGEPLMYPALFDVLESAKEMGYSESAVYTNASLVTTEAARRLRGLVDTVAVHLDAIDPRVFESVHVNKEAERARQCHRAALQGVQNLMDAGFAGQDIRLTLTLCRPVLAGLRDLFDWAFCQHGLQTSIFIPLAPFGRGMKIPASWIPSDSEIQYAYEMRARYEQRPYLLQLGVAEYCKQYQMTACYVEATGLVSPYAGSEHTCGNIHEASLTHIAVREHRALAYIGMPSIPVCRACRNNAFCFGNPVLGERQLGLAWCSKAGAGDGADCAALSRFDMQETNYGGK